MVLSISAAVFLTIIVIVLCRSGGLKASHALICGVWGFVLASTSLAPVIGSLLRAIIDLLSGRA